MNPCQAKARFRPDKSLCPITVTLREIYSSADSCLSANNRTLLYAEMWIFELTELRRGRYGRLSEIKEFFLLNVSLCDVVVNGFFKLFFLEICIFWGLKLLQDIKDGFFLQNKQLFFRKIQGFYKRFQKGRNVKMYDNYRKISNRL